MTQLNRFSCVCCALMLLAPAAFAQRNLIKGGKNVAKALTGAPAKLPAITSRAASALPKTVTATQLKIKFPEEYVQLEIPFPAQSPVTETLAESISKKIEKVSAIGVLGGGNGNLSSTFKTPDGELVRKVVLGPEHFSKSNKAGTTMGYLKTQKMSYPLQNPKGAEIIVAKNDKLRYLSDLKAVVKRDDFLVRNAEGGTVEIVRSQQAPAWMTEGFEAAYKKENSSHFDFHFAFSPEPVAVRHFTGMKALLEDRAAAELRIELPSHPLTKAPATVYNLLRTCEVVGVGELGPRTMIVRHQDGSFDVHAFDEIPPVLESQIIQATPVVRSISLEVGPNGEISASKEALEIETIETWTKAGFPLLYEAQSQLAKDLHAFYKGIGKKQQFLGQEVIVYELPCRIGYKPVGREGTFLEPNGSKVVIYNGRGGQIVDRSALELYNK